MSLDESVDSSNITTGTLSTESGPIVMSNPPHPDNQLKTQTIRAENLDQLKEIFASTGLSVKSNAGAKSSTPGISADDIPGSPEELDTNHLQNLEQATRAYLNDEAELPDSVKDLVTKTHGATDVQTYDVQNIVVTPSNPWIISGQGPVVVRADQVIVQAGGQIKILTDASITITELIKQ